MKKTVDARKIPCPGPVIEVKKALKDMEQGTLLVLVDNEAAVLNLTKLASYLKLLSVSEKIDDGTYRVTIDVGENGTPDGEEERGEHGKSPSQPIGGRLCIQDSRKTGMLIVLSSDQMGEGDEALGKILMKGFLYALTELEQLPETILLYNGGAKLSVEGSDSLEDLKTLEDQGVEVLTCGTCLNHYGLTEKLGVGSVTNMYVIAEKMAAASSLIKP